MTLKGHNGLARVIFGMVRVMTGTGIGVALVVCVALNFGLPDLSSPISGVELLRSAQTFLVVDIV